MIHIGSVIRIEEFIYEFLSFLIPCLLEAARNIANTRVIVRDLASMRSFTPIIGTFHTVCLGDGLGETQRTLVVLFFLVLILRRLDTSIRCNLRFKFPKCALWLRSLHKNGKSVGKGSGNRIVDTSLRMI